MKIVQKKKCSTCGIEKDLCEFTKQKHGKFGLCGSCRACKKITTSIYRKNNAKKESDRGRAYRKANPEITEIYLKINEDKIKQARKEYYIKNRKRILARSKQYHIKNKAACNKRSRDYSAAHKGDRPKKNKLYREANREKIRVLNRAYQNKQYRENIDFKLNMLMSGGIRNSLNGDKSRQAWLSLVPYTKKQLMKHLEKLFTEDMTWEKFLKGEVHIDHRIPKSVFNFTKPEHADFKKCWALKNLQPMWAGENIKKGAKLNKHFQPSLLF